MSSLAYASLLLHDAGVAITAANIQALLKAAKLTVAATDATTVESSLRVTSVDTLVSASLGGSSSAAAAPSAAPAAAAAKVEAPKLEEPIKEEEADFDMGDLFG